MNEFVVELDHVWKKYPLRKDTPGIKEFVLHLNHFIKQREKQTDFYALKDFTLRIRRGECVGIIGKNGAGKSTLLSLILGTAIPSKGRIKVSELVTPLLELGAGFHPDLTGRENLILNGILLGLTKREIEREMDSIIDFSGIGEFIDIPIRTYSSGMYLRLAFSISIHINPKIFIIDEVLAVGDEGFQTKSRQALLKLISSGVATVLVSHNLQAIETICNRAICLDHGEVVVEGEPKIVVEEYRKKFLYSG